MGGVLVIVKTCISKYGTQVYKKFNFSVIVKIDKQLLKTNSGVFFISIYVPPSKSPFYNDTDSVGVQRLEEFLVTNNLTDKPVVICGDLNARTASEDDFLVGDNNVPDMIEVSHVIEGDIGLQRVSKDNDINKFGRDLLQMCKHTTFISQMDAWRR